jgi:hypothetical protein
LVEQRIENPRVDGSIPSQATKLKAAVFARKQRLFLCAHHKALFASLC